VLRGQIVTDTFLSRIDRLPIVVSIDCEPDARVTPAVGQPDWEGMAGMIAMIAAWRARVPGARVGWYWRADEQVARGHGDPGWALRAFRNHIDATSALGDEHGLHSHLWRWDQRAQNWVSDFADEEWAQRCVRDSADTFTRALGHRARVMRMGDGYMSPHILAAMEQAGVCCDLTIEPGAAATLALVPGERTVGLIPDRRASPRRPFQPELHDPLCASSVEEPGRLWALPLTTAPRGLTGIPPGTAAILGFSPDWFRRIVTAGLAASAREGAPYLSVVARSDFGRDPERARATAENLDWLARSGAGLAPPEFVDPLEALKIVTNGRSGNACPR